MFNPLRSETGAVLPWIYLPAEPGEYLAGQLLTVESGLVKTLESGATPLYLCMANREIALDSDLLPVTRISTQYVYETTLETACESVDVGAMLAVSDDGMQVKEGSGVFEVESFAGKEEGAVVRGRFLTAACGTVSTMMHGALSGRDAANQHPIEAISGLEEQTAGEIKSTWNEN